MSLVGRPAGNHPQQRTSDEIDDRATTAEVFDPLNAAHGPFTIDVAAAAHNAKCARYYTRQTDGLAQSWAGERVWCNPPFSSIEPWLIKAWAEHHHTLGIVMLPANRCEQGWWQRLVEPYRDRPGSPLTVRFLPGRLRFLKPGATSIGADERPPFGCCVLVWAHAGPAPTALPFPTSGVEL